MAITQVANPSSVPAAIADYEAQNAHISAFNNIVNNQPFILTNSGGTGLPAIKIGTYIQYGGNLYVVDTEDYAITGTPVDGNNYIRLSGSTTLTAEWVQTISGYVWNEVYGYKESGSYFLLPYLVVKDGTEYEKYSMLFDIGIQLTNLNGHIATKYSIGNYIDSFNSPGAGGVFGLTSDGTNLISCNLNSDLIYIHDGVSGSVLSSFAAPATSPSGLTFDGTNLISCDSTSGLIYIHNGITNSISSSFASPGGTPMGLAFDGTNLISCDINSDLIYIHNGVSGSVLSSFAAPSTGPRGLAFDGTNLISCCYDLDMLYIHSGVTDEILARHISPAANPSGLTYIDGVGLISCDTTAAKIYVHREELRFYTV